MLSPNSGVVLAKRAAHNHRPVQFTNRSSVPLPRMEGMQNVHLRGSKEREKSICPIVNLLYGGSNNLGNRRS